MAAAVRFLGIWTVVAALVVVTPVVGWCPAAEHRSQSLHPLFEHIHHVGLEADDASAGHAHAEHGTSWSVSTAFGAAGWMAGVQALPPPPPLGIALVADAYLASDVRRPAEHLAAPPFPPPRATG